MLELKKDEIEEFEELTELDTAAAWEIYDLAVDELAQERYAKSREAVNKITPKLDELQLESTRLSAVILAQRNKFIDWFTQNIVSIFITLVILAVLSVVFYHKGHIYMIRRKVRHLKIEEKVLLNLIKKAQTSYYQEASIPKRVFDLKTDMYKARVEEIKAELPVYEEKLKELVGSEQKIQKPEEKSTKKASISPSVSKTVKTEIKESKKQQKQAVSKENKESFFKRFFGHIKNGFVWVFMLPVRGLKGIGHAISYVAHIPGRIFAKIFHRNSQNQVKEVKKPVAGPKRVQKVALDEKKPSFISKIFVSIKDLIVAILKFPLKILHAIKTVVVYIFMLPVRIIKGIFHGLGSGGHKIIEKLEETKIHISLFFSGFKRRLKRR